MTVAVPVAAGLYRIPTAPFDLVNTYAFVEESGEVTLVDAGMAGADTRILAGLADIGVAPQDVTRVLVSHNHSDHVGGLHGLVEDTGAAVSAHEADAADISAGRGAPLDRRSWFGRLRTRQFGTEPAVVDEQLHDGQLLDVGGGVRVVHTPGHTPGHVSFLHEPSGTLITGDAVWNMNSRRTWPVLAFCSDMAQTKQTAHVLGELDYTNAAFTHGPEILGSGREAIRSFLRRPRGFRMFL